MYIIGKRINDTKRLSNMNISQLPEITGKAGWFMWAYINHLFKVIKLNASYLRFQIKNCSIVYGLTNNFDTNHRIKLS